MIKRISTFILLVLLSCLLISCEDNNGALNDDDLHFTVIFKNYDETVLKTESVKKGGSATPPDNPSRLSTNEYSYIFKNWVGNFQKVNKNEIVIVNFDTEVRLYSVRFLNPDGAVLSSHQVTFLSSLVPPNDPKMEGYENYTYRFVNWEGNYDDIANDMDITAKYDKYQTIELTKENFQD